MTYNYTKPLRPIAAMYRGPGPSVLHPGLIGRDKHDPRSQHRRMPNCIIGLLCPLKSKTLGPGPVYWLDSMYKDGKYLPPAYTIGFKFNDLSKFVTPGPPAYEPENHMDACSTFPTAPMYSMASRAGPASRFVTPGANAYKPDPMMGTTIRAGKPTAPKYSLVHKNSLFSFTYDYAKSPGPGRYAIVRNDLILRREPCYSVTGRNYPPDNNTRIPGPGAHENEKCWIHKTEPPQYSMGIRHTQYKHHFVLPEDEG